MMTMEMKERSKGESELRRKSSEEKKKEREMTKETFQVNKKEV